MAEGLGARCSKTLVEQNEPADADEGAYIGHINQGRNRKVNGAVNHAVRGIGDEDLPAQGEQGVSPRRRRGLATRKQALRGKLVRNPLDLVLSSRRPNLALTAAAISLLPRWPSAASRTP